MRTRFAIMSFFAYPTSPHFSIYSVEERSLNLSDIRLSTTVRVPNCRCDIQPMHYLKVWFGMSLIVNRLLVVQAQACSVHDLIRSAVTLT
jgi:hypothetical protein